MRPPDQTPAQAGSAREGCHILVYFEHFQGWNISPSALRQHLTAQGNITFGGGSCSGQCPPEPPIPSCLSLVPLPLPSCCLSLPEAEHFISSLLNSVNSFLPIPRLSRSLWHITHPSQFGANSKNCQKDILPLHPDQEDVKLGLEPGFLGLTPGTENQSLAANYISRHPSPSKHSPSFQSTHSAPPAPTAQTPRVRAPNHQISFAMLEGISCIFKFILHPNQLEN